jgi:sporadic carbohydrate cluster protein (TIGR04323 family)
VENRIGYRGYVSPREFGGLRVPVPVQSLVLRDYCARNKFLYKLHLNENIFPHSYMVLDGLVRNLDGLEGLLIFSLFMMPERAQRRAELYEHAFRQQAQLHFVLEGLVMRQPADVAAIEDILLIYQTLGDCPKTIPGTSELHALPGSA